jgi:hypothetical protein
MTPIFALYLLQDTTGVSACAIVGASAAAAYTNNKTASQLLMAMVSSLSVAGVTVTQRGKLFALSAVAALLHVARDAVAGLSTRLGKIVQGHMRLVSAQRKQARSPVDEAGRVALGKLVSAAFSHVSACWTRLAADIAASAAEGPDVIVDATAPPALTGHSSATLIQAVASADSAAGAAAARVSAGLVGLSLGCFLEMLRGAAQLLGHKATASALAAAGAAPLVPFSAASKHRSAPDRVHTALLQVIFQLLASLLATPQGLVSFGSFMPHLQVAMELVAGSGSGGQQPSSVEETAAPLFLSLIGSSGHPTLVSIRACQLLLAFFDSEEAEKLDAVDLLYTCAPALLAALTEPRAHQDGASSGSGSSGALTSTAAASQAVRSQVLLCLLPLYTLTAALPKKIGKLPADLQAMAMVKKDTENTVSALLVDMQSVATATALRSLIHALLTASNDIVLSGSATITVTKDAIASTAGGDLLVHGLGMLSLATLARNPSASSGLFRLAALASPRSVWPVARHALVSVLRPLLLDGPASVQDQFYALLLGSLAVADACGSSPNADDALVAQVAAAVLPLLRAPFGLQLDTGASSPAREAPILLPVLSAISPSFWQKLLKLSLEPLHAVAPTTHALLTHKADVCLADVALRELLAVVQRGPAGASSLARQALSKVSLDAGLLARWLLDAGVACPSSAQAGKKTAGNKQPAKPLPAVPYFANATSVDTKLKALAKDKKEAAAHIARATVFAELLVSALSPASSKSGRKLAEEFRNTCGVLVAPVFAAIEILVALPKAVSAGVLNGDDDDGMADAAGASNAAKGGMTFSLAAGADSDDSDASSVSEASSTTMSDDESNVKRAQKTSEVPDFASSCEYATHTLLGALHSITHALTHQSAAAVSQDGDRVDEHLAGAFDVDLVVFCVQDTASTQTRNAALLLLGQMCALLPRRVLSRLIPVFLSVGSATLSREDAYSLSVIQRLVETVVPPLRMYGAKAGVTVHSLLDVFARCVKSVPTHRQKSLYLSLVRAVAVPIPGEVTRPNGSGSSTSSRYLASLLGFLLEQRVLASSKAVEGEEEGDVAALGASVASLFPSSKSSKASKPKESEEDKSTESLMTDGIASLCSSVAHRFAARDQVKCLSRLLSVTLEALNPSSLSEGGAPSAPDEEDEADLRSLMPLLLRSGAERITNGQRYALATEIMLFVASHMASRPFLAIALAEHEEFEKKRALAEEEATLATAAYAVARKKAQKKNGGKVDQDDPMLQELQRAASAAQALAQEYASLGLQTSYLLLAERLFDLMQVAADGKASSSDAAHIAIGESKSLRSALEKARSKDRSSAAGKAEIERIRVLSAEASRRSDGFETLAGFWQRVMEGTYSCLDALSALLTPASFLTVMSELLKHREANIRRRSLIFFNEHLRNAYGEEGSNVQQSFAEDERVVYLALVEDLTSMASGKAAVDEEDLEDSPHHTDVMKQMAMDSLCILARYLARTNPEPFVDAFKAVLHELTTHKDALPLPVRSSAILCCASLYPLLGPRVIPHIPTFVPKVLDALEWTLGPLAVQYVAAAKIGSATQQKTRAPALAREEVAALRMSALVSLRFVVAALPVFMNPYLPRLFRALFNPAVTGILTNVPKHALFGKYIEKDLLAIASLAKGEDAAQAQGGDETMVAEEASDLPPGCHKLLSGGFNSLVLSEARKPSGRKDRDFALESNLAASALPHGMLGTKAASLYEFDARGATSNEATELIRLLAQVIEPRILLPALIEDEDKQENGLFAWAVKNGPAACVAHLRAVHSAIAGMTRKQVKEHSPRLLRYVLSVLEYRWRAAEASDVEAILLAPKAASESGELEEPAVNAAVRMNAAAVAASAVEVNLITTLSAFLLRMSEAQARPLLLRLLQWGFSDPQTVKQDADLGGMGQSIMGVEPKTAEQADAYFKFAALCRRITLFRIMEALTKCFKQLFVPFFSNVLPEIARELMTGVEATVQFNNGGEHSTDANKKARLAVGDETESSEDESEEDEESEEEVAKVPEKKRARVRFGGDSDSDESDARDADSGAFRKGVIASDDEAEDSEEEMGSEDEERPNKPRRFQPKKTSLPAKVALRSSLPYATLFPLDGLWHPAQAVKGRAGPVLHDDKGPRTIVPSTPHSLRCMALACLNGCLTFDAITAQEVDGFMAKGGRERLDVILKPLVAQFELPLAAKKSAVAAALASASKKGDSKKRSRASITLPEHEENGTFSALATAGIPMASGMDGMDTRMAAKNAYHAFVDTYLTPTIGLLVVCLRRDTLWKPVNTAVLMLTRSSFARVRLAGVEVCKALYDNGSNEALVLLPETLPFLSEIMHDDDPEVEAACHNLIKLLEDASGENLETYLA